jgi:hypothetical protein
MDPRKERAVPVRAQPLERTVDDLGPRPLDHVHRRSVPESVEIELVEVLLEALRDPPAPIEYE